jgi:membrane fusion protein, multidrug efflux system
VQFDQLQVAYCHITAPFFGRVGLRLVDPGNLVNAGATLSSTTNPLLVITQIQPITVIFTLPEDSLGPVETQLLRKCQAYGRRLRSHCTDENCERQVAGSG